MMRRKIPENMRVNKVVKYFVLADLSLFAGWGFVAPLLSVFVIEEISGATLFTVGAIVKTVEHTVVDI